MATGSLGSPDAGAPSSPDKKTKYREYWKKFVVPWPPQPHGPSRDVPNKELQTCEESEGGDEDLSPYKSPDLSNAVFSPTVRSTSATGSEEEEISEEGCAKETPCGATRATKSANTKSKGDDSECDSLNARTLRLGEGESEGDSDPGSPTPMSASSDGMVSESEFHEAMNDGNFLAHQEALNPQSSSSTMKTPNCRQPNFWGFPMVETPPKTEVSWLGMRSI